MAPPQQAVLTRAECERIKSSLNQPKAKVYTRQEVVDSNLRQFNSVEERRFKDKCIKMDALRKRRIQAREENLNRLAAEEVEMKKQDRQQAVEKAQTLRFHQNGCVRKLNVALLKTHVQKENEAILQFNREKQIIVEGRKRQSEEEMRFRQSEALRREQEKARQRQLHNQTVADHNIRQTKKATQLREEERRQKKDESDRLRDLDELHAQEQRHQAEQKVESKKSTLKYRQEDISSRNLQRERDAEKLNTEEKVRKHVQFDIEGEMQQRKDYQAGKVIKYQRQKDIVIEKLAVSKKEQAFSTTLKEEAKLSREVAEEDAKVAEQQMVKEDKRAAMLESISAHRETKMREKEQKMRAEEQSILDRLQAQKQSDRLVLVEKDQKTMRIRGDNIKCRDSNFTLMAENQARVEQLKMEEHDAAEKHAEQIAEMEKQLQQYVQCELHQAAEGQQNVPHLIAARTGRHGFSFYGEGPEYYCKTTGEPMPTFATDQTRHMKQYLERDRLQLSMVDMEPTCLPPLSTAAKLKSKDSLAAKEVVAERRSTTAGVEMSQYISKDTGEALPRLGTVQTRSMKQYLGRNKLQLSHMETSEVDLKQPCPPPISNRDKLKSKDAEASKQETAGQRCPPAVVEDSHNRSKAPGHSLLSWVTDQTQSTKEYLERNKQQLVCLTPIANKIQLKYPKTLASKETTGGQSGPTVSVDPSKVTGGSLPRYVTPQTRSTKQSMAQNKLQLISRDSSKVDLRLTHLPPVPTKKAPAGRRCPPAGVERPHYRPKAPGVSVPRLATAQTQSTKRYLEKL